jgi:hypothetical protein
MKMLFVGFRMEAVLIKPKLRCDEIVEIDCI